MSSEPMVSNGIARRRSEKHAAFLAFAEALLRASRGEQDPTSMDTRQFVTFFVRDHEFGIPILQCREIIRVSTITRIPESPAHVRGVVNLRGRVLPVVDMRKQLGFEALQPTSKARLLVVEAAGRAFALLVDRISRILKLSSAEIALATGDAPSTLVGTSLLGTARIEDSAILLFDIEQTLGAASSAAASTPKE